MRITDSPYMGRVFRPCKDAPHPRPPLLRGGWIFAKQKDWGSYRRRRCQFTLQIGRRSHNHALWYASYGRFTNHPLKNLSLRGVLSTTWQSASPRLPSEGEGFREGKPLPYAFYDRNETRLRIGRLSTNTQACCT